MESCQTLLEVRESPIQGNGVFATRRIAKGRRLIEYKGVRREEACYADDDEAYVCLFDIGRGLVIDPRTNGNIAQYINHSCTPNCESVLEDGRVYIETVRPIAAGEEITYDYAVTVDSTPSRAEREQYVCRCGSSGCRGTLLDLASAEEHRK